MSEQTNPHDLVAVLMIVAATALTFHGDTVTGPMLLATMGGYYFGSRQIPYTPIKNV